MDKFLNPERTSELWEAVKKQVSQAQAGTVPTSRTVNGRALNEDINLTAADVGAVTVEQVNAAIQAAVLDSWERSY